MGAKQRAALMQTAAQLEDTSRIVEGMQAQLKGILSIDHVMPDYYTLRLKKVWAAAAVLRHFTI